ncbi:hypothetical protein LIER_02817 [Lithospermum erythrorhizon]|uniref:Uncharacterized protein n=1 Tax=Lithospermum erythrorhizon TaxID=34254 RepID=A0AAV3NQX1_LITER
MGTEVLRPQDCLVERFPDFGYNTKINYNTNNHAYYKKPCMVQTYHKRRYNNQNHQHQQRNESKVVSLSRHSNTRNEFEMGKVSSFRRGGSLDSLNCRIKKDRRSMTYFDQADVYAGSACSVSPSPSSLPLPTFFQKQELNSFDDSATRDLRRLLGLE